MYVFCVHMYSYIPVSRTSLRTRSNALTMHFPLSFSLSKIAYIDYSIFKSDDIAFLFRILTAFDTRCH